jgi:hypothetical protein
VLRVVVVIGWLRITRQIPLASQESNGIGLCGRVPGMRHRANHAPRHKEQQSEQPRDAAGSGMLDGGGGRGHESFVRRAPDYVPAGR